MRLVFAIVRAVTASRTGEGTAISGVGILEAAGALLLAPPPRPEPPSMLLHPALCTGAGLHHCGDQLLCPLASCGAGPIGALAGAPGRGAGAGTFIPPLPCVGVAVGCCVPWLKVTAPDRQPSPELLGTTPSPDAADLRAGEGSRWVLHNPGVSRTLCPQLCKLCLCGVVQFESVICLELGSRQLLL